MAKLVARLAGAAPLALKTLKSHYLAAERGGGFADYVDLETTDHLRIVRSARHRRSVPSVPRETSPRVHRALTRSSPWPLVSYLRLGLLFAIAAAIADGAVGQSRRPPVPAPPVRELVLCAARLENPFWIGVETRRDAEGRAFADQLVAALYQKERDRLTEQVEDELGPLAWSVFVPGEASAAQKRFDELLTEACVHSALLRGRKSADVVMRERSLQLLDRYDAPVTLPESFFMGGSGRPMSRAGAALRLELPPSELIVPGGLITGRVVLDTGSAGAGGASTETLGDGLLAEVAGQIARVGRDGLFALRVPEQPVPTPSR